MEVISDLHTQNVNLFATWQLTVLQDVAKTNGVVWGNGALALRTEVELDSHIQGGNTSSNCQCLINPLVLVTAGTYKKQDTAYNILKWVQAVYNMCQS